MNITYIWKQIAALFAIAIFSLAVCAQESKPISITIPQGTQLTARLASQLDSGQVQVGDPVTMDVLEDLKIENAIAIPRGSIVMGHVTNAKGARKMGRGGQLDISFETVTAGDGTRVPISGGTFAKGKGGYGGGSLVGAGAAGLFFPPAGALLLLKHGHASVIPVGTILTVHVTADTSVAGTRPRLAVAASSDTVPAEITLHPTSAAKPATIRGEVISGVQSSQEPESLGDYARRMKAEKAALKP
jgi:hypothetical protein